MKMISMVFVLHIEDYMLPCFSKKIFEIECLGCGLQRSVVFLLKGDFLLAFKMYPAIFTIIPLLLFLLADTFYKIRYANIISITLMISSVVLVLTNYILKFI